MPWYQSLTDAHTANAIANAYAAQQITAQPQWYQPTTSASTTAYYPIQAGTTCTPTCTNIRHIWIWDEEEMRYLDQTAYMELARWRASASREEREARRMAAAQAREVALARQREQERQNQERIAKADAAKERSLELLLAHLTEKQRATFEKNKWFVVEGGKSKQLYKVQDLGHLRANVAVIHKNGIVIHRLCCHCDFSLPHYDQLLAQKVMLEYDEDNFLRLANRHAA